MRTIDASETGVVSGRFGFRFALPLSSMQGEQGLECGGLGGRVAPGGGRRKSVLGGLSAASLLRTPPPGVTRPPFTGVGAGLVLGGVMLDVAADIRPERQPRLVGSQADTSGTNRPRMPAQEGLSWHVNAPIIVAPFLSALENSIALAVAAAVSMDATVLAQADRSFMTLGAVL